MSDPAAPQPSGRAGGAAAGGGASRGALGVSTGWVGEEVARELPQLQLLFAEVQLRPGTTPLAASPPGVREQLASMSSRFNGSRAIHLRREEVPAAYRVFFRQIGLDPDLKRTPVEDAALERMLDGAFLSRGLLADILLIALMDTGVPVWAMDAQSLHGPLGVRGSLEGEPLGRGRDPDRLDAGRLVVADASSALALIFDEAAPGHRVHGACRRLLLYTLQVAGVSGLALQEALWICRSALTAGNG